MDKFFYPSPYQPTADRRGADWHKHMNGYQGHYAYNHQNITDWQGGTFTGVYYCGYVNERGNLVPLYIGKGSGLEGVRGRLLAHVSDDHWPDVTAFGYIAFASIADAEAHEAAEIRAHKPKYNTQLT